MVIEDFIGREAEIRTLLANVERGRSSLLVGGAGVGKSTLLHHVEPMLEQIGTHVPTTRVGPGFGGFLRELFMGLWEHGALATALEQAGAGKSMDARTELKAWGRLCPSNDEKAKWLLERVEEHGNVIVTIDDAQGVTASNRPWLERLTEAATVVAAVDPAALRKAGSKRFWKRFDEIRLDALLGDEAAALLDRLVARYRVTADEPEIYCRRVLALAQGNPFELKRLVKHYSAETLVKARDLRHLGQEFIDRDVRQIALAPILLGLGAAAIAARYVAPVQGNLDLYVLSGIGIALMIALMPLLRTAVRRALAASPTVLEAEAALERSRWQHSPEGRLAEAQPEHRAGRRSTGSMTSSWRSRTRTAAQ